MRAPGTDVHWHIRNFGATGGSKSSYETGSFLLQHGAFARFVLGLISANFHSLDEVRLSHMIAFSDHLPKERIMSVVEISVSVTQARAWRPGGRNVRLLHDRLARRSEEPSRGRLNCSICRPTISGGESRNFGNLAGYYNNHGPIFKNLCEMRIHDDCHV